MSGSESGSGNKNGDGDRTVLPGSLDGAYFSLSMIISETLEKRPYTVCCPLSGRRLSIFSVSFIAFRIDYKSRSRLHDINEPSWLHKRY